MASFSHGCPYGDNSHHNPTAKVKINNRRPFRVAYPSPQKVRRITPLIGADKTNALPACSRDLLKERFLFVRREIVEGFKGGHHVVSLERNPQRVAVRKAPEDCSSWRAQQQRG
jgi:hypothetical protein